MLEKVEKLIKQLSSFLTMKRIYITASLGLVIAFLVMFLMLPGKNIALLDPKGLIAEQQLDLLVFTTLLGLVVIIPVFVLLFVFAYKYRASNKKADYQPDKKDNVLLEIIWWGIPILIILLLSVVTWVTTHQLDPYKPIESSKEPVKVQVVAMQWNWLFIYPDHGVASVNELPMPVGAPVEFSITADAPMSAFWIPNLGSQTYAMNGMTAKLHLVADKPGVYPGMNTNINGEGYAKMRFKANAMSQAEFDAWVSRAAGSDNHLDWNEYTELSQPTKDIPPRYFMLHESDIYDRVIAKYMDHGGGNKSTDNQNSGHNHEGMGH
jgi:cytochrome o ubiquinol oxidase subunit 2